MNNDIPKSTIKSAVIFILGVFVVISAAIFSLHSYDNLRKYNAYKAMSSQLEGSQHLAQINKLSDSLDIKDTDMVLDVSKNLYYLEEEMGNYYHECAIYYLLQDKIYKVNPYVHNNHFYALQPVSSLPDNIKNTILLMDTNSNRDHKEVYETLNDTEDLKCIHPIKNGYLYIKKDRN